MHLLVDFLSTDIMSVLLSQGKKKHILTKITVRVVVTTCCTI